MKIGEIDVRYSCAACGITDAAVRVPMRGEQQGVVDWVRLVVTSALGRDHFAKSPLCTVEALTEVKIPLAADGGRIGDPTKH